MRLTVVQSVLLVSVTCVVCGCDPVISTSASTLEFGFEESEMEFEVFNGNEFASFLQWEAEADEDWIELSPTQGFSTGPTDRTVVHVTIDRSEVSKGNRESAEVEISGNDAQSRTVTLLVDIPLEVDAANLEPKMVYLSWVDDTSTTMTVNFQTETDDEEVLPFMSPLVYYASDPIAEDFSNAQSVRGEARDIGDLDSDNVLHTITLRDLEPGESYYFVGRVELTSGAELEEGEAHPETARTNRFQTVPMTDEIRFVTGGDMDFGGRAREMLVVMASLDPMFAVIGGDITYPYLTPFDVELSEQEQWEDMLELWDERMRTSDGHMVPMVLGVGNHDADYTENDPFDILSEGEGYVSLGADEFNAPFFLRYVPQEDRSYFSRSFGTDLVVYVLDSGHVAPHGGAQLSWLVTELEANQLRTHQFALYHVPLYPSGRAFDLPISDPEDPSGQASASGRAIWGPVFSEFGLDTAFENHDHLHKRTGRLRYDPDACAEYLPDDAGTLFLGDGSLGRNLRVPNGEPYLASSTSAYFTWLVQTAGSMVIYTAVDIDGNVIDECSTMEAEDGTFVMDCPGEILPCIQE